MVVRLVTKARDGSIMDVMECRNNYLQGIVGKISQHIEEQIPVGWDKLEITIDRQG